MTIIFSLYSSKTFTQKICKALHCEVGEMIVHQFPDSETYIKILSDVESQDVIFVTTLNKPNQKILPLLFAAQTVKDLGANNIGLIAPYLSYMRQDKSFQTGEAITAKYFSQIISHYFDWMVTLDPHLHRIKNLYEIYGIPTYSLNSAVAIASWIKNNIKDPLIIGPDKESEQWVKDIAEIIGVPCVTLEKKRIGDKSVKIILPSLKSYKNLTPVLVDDIISSGATMIEALNQLRKVKKAVPFIVAIHAIFAKGAYHRLLKLGAKIITTNTIKHVSNKIDIASIIIEGVKKVRQDKP